MDTTHTQLAVDAIQTAHNLKYTFRTIMEDTVGALDYQPTNPHQKEIQDLFKGTLEIIDNMSASEHIGQVIPPRLLGDLLALSRSIQTQPW